MISVNNELTQTHSFEKKELPAITVPFPKEKEPSKDSSNPPQLIKYKLNPKSEEMNKWNSLKAQYAKINGNNSKKVFDYFQKFY